MKVVELGYKIDLHIHSVWSHIKGKEKVAFNTEDDIDEMPEVEGIANI